MNNIQRLFFYVILNLFHYIFCSKRIKKMNALLVLSILLTYIPCFADISLFQKVVDETLVYFRPMKGIIKSVEGKKAVIDLGSRHGVKKDMRFSIIREQAPFRHPVTKELLGNLEAIVGRLHVIETSEDSSICEIIDGNGSIGDKVRISEVKLNLLFYQTSTSDWYTADLYYKELKDTGRFNMIDTSVNKDDANEIIKEAKRLNADVAIFVDIKEKESKLIFTQDLYWVTDGYRFGHLEQVIEGDFAKEARFADKFFKIYKEEPWLEIELPFNARFIGIADIYGDLKKEIIFATDNGIGLLNFFDGKGYESIERINLPDIKSGEILWLDSLDFNKNGRDEIAVTYMREKKVETLIYEFYDKELKLVYKYQGFMRNLNGLLIGQEYSPSTGFEGPVFKFIYENGYKKGDALKLPQNVSIYDFIYLNTPYGIFILSYDDKGYLKLYEETGKMVWRSKEPIDGFLEKFSKESPTIMVDRGEWSIKDRLFYKKNQVIFIKRIPLINMVKGLGYKESKIYKLFWNGLSMEESILIDNIKGNILDYLVLSDRILILSRPFFGFKPEKILKGENPLKTTLYIYSLKGIY